MYKLLKNIIDRFLAFLLLIVLIVIPILPLTMLFIYIEDRSNVFFLQERVGISGENFYVWKFRSMYVNADKQIKESILSGETDSLNFKNQAGNMVTTVGKFIRKTSIDELPQLINIIKGDMSIVGPRPLQTFEVDEYVTISSNHWQKMEKRLSVKPGLLCFWQVTKNKNDMPFEERMDLDVAYVDQLSMKTDLKILLQGIKTVLFSNNM